MQVAAEAVVRPGTWLATRRARRRLFSRISEEMSGILVGIVVVSVGADGSPADGIEAIVLLAVLQLDRCEAV